MLIDIEKSMNADTKYVADAAMYYAVAVKKHNSCQPNTLERKQWSYVVESAKLCLLHIALRSGNKLLAYNNLEEAYLATVNEFVVTPYRDTVINY